MMKNKTIDILLVGIVIVIFVGYFWIKQSVWGDVHMVENLNRIEEYARNDQWEEAEKLAKHIHSEWEKKKLVILVNFGEAEFSLLEESLSFVLAGTEAKDHVEVYGRAKMAEDIWTNFNRVVPEP
ncbi:MULTISPECIES: DUF4363 family protein [Pontibacillus]|uniref:DUF4363 family protein n=1 Tax=Pontibacillus chungwhensis TaxID=265426 RepID=A0ABY8V0M5_9BACI|nr:MULTISPECIES: DUF4363 family protein [Pontibacillus]MCD5324364.1 DUF4363 family protein [Pontibacillus sp. HN14]WIF99337.1 DUF4363 family protein [Pontibacillus chungwhensis]